MNRSRTSLILLVGALAVALVWFLAGDRTPDDGGPLDGGTEAGEGTPGDPDLLEAREAGGANGAGSVPGSRAAATPTAGKPITGIVIDDRERPIAGAAVKWFQVDERGLRGAPFPDRSQIAGATIETTTDRDGRFEARTSWVGWTRLLASAPDRAAVGVLVAGGGVDVVIRLPAAATLSVNVIDEKGRPVVGARIEASAGDTRLAAPTEAKGRALLSSLPPGDVRLRVSADGYGTVRAGPLRVRAGEPVSTTVVLPRGVPIAGFVLDDATGGPIVGARVHVSHPGRSTAAQPTSAAGRFGPLPGGGVGERVFLVADADGYLPALEPVVLQGKDVQNVVIRMQAGEAWSGRVEPPPGKDGVVEVGYTTDGTAGREPATATAGADGRFRLPPPPDPLPGRRVVLFAIDASSGARAALALRPGMLRPEPLVLRLNSGTAVTGSVRDVQDKPLAGVQVRLTPAWDRRDRSAQPDAATSLLLLSNEQGFAGLAAASDSNGGWMLPNVAPGTYEVRYRWHGGQHWREQPLEVTQETSISAGSVTLGEGLRIAGRVRDGSGRPAEGATLRVSSIDAPRHVHRATADGDGYYQVASLPAGAYVVRAFLGSYEPVATEVELAAHRDDVDLYFEPGAVIEGRVDGGGTRYSGPLQLRLLRPQGSGSRPPHTVTVKNGRFRWDEAPSGSWRIGGRAPSGAFAFADGPVDVEAGRVTGVVLTLQEPAALAGRVVAGDGPVAGARIQLTDAEGSGRRLATADAGGRFLVSGLEAGTWNLRVWGRGGAPVERTVSAEAGARRDIEIKLAPAGSARVTVLDTRGRPAAGVVVVFRSASAALPTARPDRTDRSGRVQRDDLPEGPLLVMARGAQGERGRAQTSVTADQRTEVRITLGAPPPR